MQAFPNLTLQVLKELYEDTKLGGYGTGYEYWNRWVVEHDQNMIYENLKLLKNIRKNK